MATAFPLTADPRTKPLCFGLPSVFSLVASSCKECGHFATCHDTAYMKLKAMGERFNVADMLTRFERSTSRAEVAPFKSVDAQTNQPPQATLEVSIAIPKRTTKVEKVKVDLTSSDQALIDSMPKKTQLKMRKLMQLNVDKLARESILSKVNPFPFIGNGYLHVAFDLLINGGFTRATLRQSYQQRLGWTEGTAFSHVSAVVWLFPAMKIAIEERGRFIPNPTMMRV